MRDSALKPSSAALRAEKYAFSGRRRAHARQRFETFSPTVSNAVTSEVGEELMRDSALKPKAS